MGSLGGAAICSSSKSSGVILSELSCKGVGVTLDGLALFPEPLEAPDVLYTPRNAGSSSSAMSASHLVRGNKVGGKKELFSAGNV